MSAFERYQFRQLGHFFGAMREYTQELLVNRNCQEVALSHGMAFVRRMQGQNLLGQALSSHLEQILLVMRMSQVLGNSAMTTEEFEKKFELMFYRDFPEPDQRHGDSRIYTLKKGGGTSWHRVSQLKKGESLDDAGIQPESTHLEMILSCVKAKEGACKTAFHHVVTDKGICAAYNSPRQQLVLGEGAYLSFIDSMYSTNSDQTSLVKPVLTTGSDSSLKLVLDIHQLDIQGSESGHFEINVSHQVRFFSTEKSLSVMPGMRSNIYVEVIQVAMEADLWNKTSIEDRGCRAGEDTIEGLTLFEEYTQEGCRFECKLVHAKKMAKCLPWDVLHRDDELDFPVCTGNLTFTFWTELSRSDICSDCNPAARQLITCQAWMWSDQTMSLNAKVLSCSFWPSTISILQQVTIKSFIILLIKSSIILRHFLKCT